MYAGDLLSGVTVFQVRPAALGLPPTLVPCSSDTSGRARLPVLPLSDSQLLAAVHPQGLGLLQRHAGG